MLVLRASMTGVADGTVVAIRGLLVWMPLTEPTYNRTRLTTLAWRARILSQKALPNLARLSPGFGGAPSLLGAEINAEAERSREPRRGKSAEAKVRGPAKA
jgi:hypothetical protein